MQYLISPQFPDSFSLLTWWDNEFTKEELDWLQQEAISAEEVATTGVNNSIEVVRQVRKSKVKWVNYSLEIDWLYKKLSHIISKLNADFFQFNLLGFGEPIQLTNYDSSEKGNYDWHIDFNPGKSRKLSLIIQLSDPSEYEGGELEIVIDNLLAPTKVLKKRGYISVFPSFVHHRVTPVTKGSRQSLVVWISGPPFK